jgi:formylglycine-generating enzyme required for sulfatase activity
MLPAVAVILALLSLPAWAQRSSGTGFAIAPGLVVTNHHVVKGCTSLAVVVPGQGSRTARLIADDPEADLALVYALGLPGSVAALRTTPARLGEQVYAFGFPLAGALASSGNFTSGLVSALRGLGDKEGELQFTAPVQPGNSGGALLDRSGLVIGVVQSKLDAIRAARITGDIPQNVNFSVAGDVLARFLARHQATAQREPPGAVLDTTVVAERAQGFTFQISCETASRAARPAAPPPRQDQSPRSSQPGPATPPAPVANAAADAERALGLSVDDIRNVQIWLTALGYDPGAADGVIGQATRRALRSYQRSRGIAETGFLSAAVLSALREDGPPAITRAVAGHRFRDCPECPEMVVVPPGSFMMGSETGDPDERPVRRVTIAAPFAVGKFEVTFDEWDACIAQGGCGHRPNDGGWGRGRQPVIYLRWSDAQSYATWLSRKTGKAYRLLSEAEWEYAAQAGSVGEQVTRAGANQANCVGCTSWWDDRRTAPVSVGSFPPNAFGLHDMLGNVAEWTADCWNENHAGAPVDGSARVSGDCSRRVVRGGYWRDHPSAARSAYRVGGASGWRDISRGFRVARTL